MRFRKTMIFFIVGFFILYVARNAVRGFRSGAGALEERLPPTFEVLKDDSLLMNEHILAGLKVRGIVNMKTRLPIANYRLFDSLDLVIFRSKLGVNFPVADLITLFRSGSISEPGVSYLSVHYSPYYKIKFLPGLPEPIKNILLFVKSDHIDITKKGNLFKIRGLCEWVSIKYEKESSNDLEALGDEMPFFVSKPIPLELIITQMGSTCFFIFITPKNSKGGIPNIGESLFR